MRSRPDYLVRQSPNQGAPTEDPRIRKHYLVFGLIWVCLFSLFPLYLILAHGVNVPYGDEYAWTGLREAIRTGHLSFATFWAPHNEHRLFLSRIAFTVLFGLIGWNSVVIMLLSWLVVTGAAFCLFLCFRAAFDSSKPRFWLATVILSFALLFSPVQRENWFWAFQLAFFLVQSGVIVSVCFACLPNQNLTFRLLLSILFAALASLSSAAGLMVWPALILAFAFGEDSKKRMLFAGAILVAATACVYAVYFTNYTTPSYGHITLADILRRPGVPLRYFIGLLGNPVTFWVSNSAKPLWTIAAGTILILLFCLFSYLNVRNGQRRNAAPWIALGCFALGSCLITTLGRTKIGLAIGLATSRYTTHALLFTIAVLALFYLTLNGRTLVGRYLNYPVAIVFLFCIGVGIAGGYLDGFERSISEQFKRESSRKLLPFISYFDRQTDGLPNGPFFALWPALNLRIFDSLLEPYAESSSIRIEYAKFVSSETGLQGKYSISGAVGAPFARVIVSGSLKCESDLSFRFVFLKKENQDKFIGGTELTISRSNDHTKVYKWQLTIPAQLLAERGRELETWVYDKTTNSFLKVQPGEAD
jgi:hypothetical protein